MNNDFDGFIELLSKIIDDAKKNCYPAGHCVLNIAVIQSQRASNLVEANKILDAVVIEKNDFLWVDDMRLLAKCYLAHKFNNKAGENKLR